MIFSATRRTPQHVALLPARAARALRDRVQSRRASWPLLPLHNLIGNNDAPCRQRLRVFHQLPQVSAVVEEDVVARVAGDAARVLLELGQTDQLWDVEGDGYDLLR